MTTNIYVDGFNLYYGAVKGTHFRWLNIERYFTLLRPHDSIHKIYYFTAEIHGPHHANQMTYLNALATLPRVAIILGRYKLKSVRCGVPGCRFPGSRVFNVPEEKRTDVQIALQMVHDAWADACDRFILVSGDSDLVPAIRMLKEISPDKKVTVYVPSRHKRRSAAVELPSAADRGRILPNELIPKAQFPVRIPDGSGGFIDKPAAW